MNSKPTGPLVIMGDNDGLSEVGARLLARPNAIKDADGMGPGSYQWTCNSMAIEGATAQAYTVQEQDRGCNISVRYTYLDGDGNQETVISKPVVIQEPVRQLGLVELAYKEILGREPDGPGWQHYQDMLDSGEMRHVVIRHIELSPEALSRKDT